MNAAAAAAVADTLARSADKIRSVLWHPRSHNLFRQRGLAYLFAPHADPIGAAVYAAVGIDACILNPDGIGRYFDDNTDLADYLVHTHGFELATSITATLAGIHCDQHLLTEAIPDLTACSTPDDASTPGSPTMPR
ncbi:hypothetical protein ACLMAL_33640 [Nocardia sp. CWNU-33]|uniref:hypothetical protein n=1 Tax=Nocardia sp. CWNU-33 TaxID=3392117 RepID=UPI00398EE837